MSDQDTHVIVPYAAMLYKICEAEGIELQFLCNNWVKRLEKAGKVRFINGYKFDLNSYGAGQVADDKYATYEALRFAKIPAVEHSILYDFSNQEAYMLGRNSQQYLLDYLRRHDNHIVLKPNCGTGGAATYAARTPEEALCALVEIFHNNPTASMCPYYKIRYEYRVILLDDEARLLYRKTLSSEGEWRLNLQHRALAEEVPAQLRKPLTQLAQRAIAAIGLRFGSVDIIETEDGEYLILEINSGVMTKSYLQQHPDKFAVVEGIYHDAIKKMFEMP